MKQLFYIGCILSLSFVQAQIETPQAGFVNASLKAKLNDTPVKTIEEFMVVYNESLRNRSQKGPTNEQKQLMNQFVQLSKSENETGSAYHLSAALTTAFDSHFFNRLQIAHNSNPQDKNTLKNITASYFIAKNKDSLKVKLQQLHTLNVYEKSDLTYAKEVLKSLSQDAILITNGFDDTYPLLMAQQLDAYRKDVILLPLLFLQSETFRTTWKLNNVYVKNKQIIDANFVESMSMNLPSKFYFSLTIPIEMLTKITGKLYPIGLTNQFNPTKVYNTIENELFWKTSTKELIFNPPSQNAKSLSANYLPLLLNLEQLHMQSKNAKAHAEILKAIKQIGTNTNNNNLIRSLGIE